MDDQKVPYRPLNTSKNEIRLLDLYIHTGGDDIKCELKRTNLDTEIRYEALSYVWGSSIDKRVITLDNRPCKVTLNLYVALQHLKREESMTERQYKRPFRRIWIDAICINQDDLDERTAQVQLMWSIFGKAWKVLGWLGEESDDSKLGMQMIRTLATHYRLQTKNKIQNMITPPPKDRPEPGTLEWYKYANIARPDAPARLPGVDYSKEYQDSFAPFRNLLFLQAHQADPADWTAFQNIYNRSWWYRIWIVQEASAGSSKMLVGCGSVWLKWSLFQEATLSIFPYLDGSFNQKLTRLSAGAMTAGRWSRYGPQDLANRPDWFTLLNVLNDTISHSSSDARDRLYALLNFAPSIPLIPDYHEPVETVFKSFVKKSIEATGMLGFLVLIRRPKRLSLPSWTPDFSLEMPREDYNVSYPMGFYAADGNIWQNKGVGTSGCVIDHEEDADSLTLMGYAYDASYFLGSTWEGNSEERQARFFSLIEEYEKMLYAFNKAQSDEFKQLRTVDRLWRTVIWNATAEDRYPAPDDFGRQFERIMSQQHCTLDIESLKDGHKFDPTELVRSLPVGPAPEWYRAFVRHGVNRRFFITRRGHIGSGPPDMRIGDMVCILLGAKAPMILREVSPKPTYELVGPAYIDGIMHGEAIARLDQVGLAPCTEKFTLV